MEKVEVYAGERKKKKMAQLKQEVGKAFKYLVSVTMQQVKSTGRM